MFYGVVVKAAKTVPLETKLGEVLHLSQACLSDPRDGGKTYLKVNNGENTFTVCCLQKDKCEHTSLDLFIQASSGVSFIAEGKNDIHLVGYWEPHSEHSDDEDEFDALMDGEESKEEDDEEDDVEHIINSGVMEAKQKLQLSGKGKAQAAKIEEIIDEDNLDEELSGSDLDDDDDDDKDDDDEDDDESEDDLEADVTAKPKALPAGASANKQKTRSDTRCKAAWYIETFWKATTSTIWRRQFYSKGKGSSWKIDNYLG